MPADQKARSAKAAAKRKIVGEEELRLIVRPGTKHALAELMQWAGIEKQVQAMQMINHLHGLDPGGALPMLEVPHNEITVSPAVTRKLQQFNEAYAHWPN